MGAGTTSKKGPRAVFDRTKGCWVPLGPHIIVKPLPSASETAGGIALPDSKKINNPVGQVLKLSSFFEKTFDLTETPPFDKDDVAVLDFVIYQQEHSYPIDFEAAARIDMNGSNDDLWIVPWQYVIAVWKNDQVLGK